MTLTERVAKLLDEQVRKEVAQINRKLQTALVQRDNWKYKAKHYRAKLLERN